MEKEIEKELHEIYKNLKIDVEYFQIRKYKIYITIYYNTIEYKSCFEYTYNAKLTFDQNIGNIISIIDNDIIINFYKRKEYQNI